jgi:hypothetical protein
MQQLNVSGGDDSQIHRDQITLRHRPCLSLYFLLRRSVVQSRGGQFQAALGVPSFRPAPYGTLATVSTAFARQKALQNQALESMARECLAAPSTTLEHLEPWASQPRSPAGVRG